MNIALGRVKIKLRIGPFSPGSLKSARDKRSITLLWYQTAVRSVHVPMFYGTPINREQAHDPLAATLLLPATAVIRTEAHTERRETETQGNAVAGFHAQAAATETIRLVTYVKEILFAFEN